MRRSILTLSIISGVMFMAGCHAEHKEHEEHSTFQVTQPIRKDTFLTREYVSQIHSIQHIELRAQEHGYLEEIFVDEGQVVQKGQRMFQIMPRLYAAEVERARAEAEVAEIEYKNTKALADSEVVSVNELAMSKAKLAKANAELALAQTHLDFTDIRAPFTGIMDRFEVRLGSLVEEGELLTELSDNSKVWVYFNVPEAEYLDYKTKVKSDSLINVELLMANGRLFPHVGVVETIEADFNNETGNIAFRATFPNPDGLLRHGETGNILMRTALKNALIIPQKATFEVLDKKFVYVVDEHNVLHSREITIGAEMPHLYAVRHGLEEGDKILLEGLRKVKNGEEIAYEPQNPNEVIAHLGVYAE